MAFEDRIIKGLEFEYQGSFNFSELLEIMKDWFDRDRYKYDFIEKAHKETPKTLVIKWANERKVDDYHKFIIKVAIKLEDKTPAKKGNINATFKIKIDGIIVRDYDDKWSNSVWKLFTRAVVDKFIESEKGEKIAKQLKKEVNSFLNTVKRYFKGR